MLMLLFSAQGHRSPPAEGSDLPTDVINPGMLASILQRHSQCCLYPHPLPFLIFL